MRALIYARVSEDPRGNGRSVTEQETECRAWAEREHWTITHVIAETGSASRYARGARARSRWPEVTSAITSGQYDALLTWESSRATRDLTAYAQLRDLCAKHHVLWGYSGTLHDLSKRDARFRTGLDALLAEDESARTSERILRSVRARASAGQPHGKLPYGYRREYDPATGALLRQVPDETTAPIVREIYERINAGDALLRIAKDLTARDVPPPRPARSTGRRDQDWLTITIRRIALSPTYAARRTHNGQVVGPAAWPALVDDTTWEKAGAVLSDPTRLTRTGDSRARWLLTGIARCGYDECGATLRRLVNRGRDTYSCPACMRVTRKVAPVDQVVEERVLALLHKHGRELAAPRDTDGEQLKAARAELDALQRRLEGFTDQAADGGLSPGALARIEARLLPKINAADRRVKALQAPTALEGMDLSDPEKLWADSDLERCRHIVRSLVDVTILPAGRGKRIFDPGLVVVTPRW